MLAAVSNAVIDVLASRGLLVWVVRTVSLREAMARSKVRAPEIGIPITRVSPSLSLGDGSVQNTLLKWFCFESNPLLPCDLVATVNGAVPSHFRL